MDEDRLTPRLGRLIDAAKAAAADAHGEGWAVLGEDGRVHAGPRLAGALDAATSSGTSPEAAAFAAPGGADDTALPGGEWRTCAAGVDQHLPVVVKYLGRWVVVTLEEIPGG